MFFEFVQIGQEGLINYCKDPTNAIDVLGIFSYFGYYYSTGLDFTATT